MIKAWFADEIGRTYIIPFESEEELEKFIEEEHEELPHKLKFLFSEGLL